VPSHVCSGAKILAFEFCTARYQQVSPQQVYYEGTSGLWCINGNT